MKCSLPVTVVGSSDIKVYILGYILKPASWNQRGKLSLSVVFVWGIPQILKSLIWSTQNPQLALFEFVAVRITTRSEIKIIPCVVCFIYLFILKELYRERCG